MHKRKCTGIDLNISMCTHNNKLFEIYYVCKMHLNLRSLREKENQFISKICGRWIGYCIFRFGILFEIFDRYYLKKNHLSSEISWIPIYFFRVIGYLSTSNFNRIIMLFILSYWWKGNNLKLWFFWTIFRIKLFYLGTYRIIIKFSRSIIFLDKIFFDRELYRSYSLNILSSYNGDWKTILENEKQ